MLSIKIIYNLVMKKIRFSILLSIWLLSVQLAWSQDCATYHEVGDCIMDRNKAYKIYSQSRSAVISATDTVEFSVVFYGQKDYICSFCTHQKFYPVHFRLIDPDTKEVLYDNKDDNYIESLGVGFDVTKTLIIQVSVLARKATPEEMKDYLSCIGLLMQYKNYPEKKVKLQM
jgi:hypothetical protein